MIIRAGIFARSILLFAFVALTGCGPSVNPNAPANVHGKVTYKGSTVTGGSVTFHFADGGKLQTAIGLDGTYSADLKEGTFVVTVETESINKPKEEYRGGGDGGAASKYGKGAAAAIKPKGKGAESSPIPEGAAAPTYVKIPAKYADKAASGLSVTSKSGKTKFDIELTD